MWHVVWGLYGLRIFYPYIFNVGRANADALRGSMKYQLTCLNIRLFKCGYRSWSYVQSIQNLNFWDSKELQQILFGKTYPILRHIMIWCNFFCLPFLAAPQIQFPARGHSTSSCLGSSATGIHLCQMPQSGGVIRGLWNIKGFKWNRDHWKTIITDEKQGLLRKVMRIGYWIGRLLDWQLAV